MSKSAKSDAPATPLNPSPWIPKSPEGTPEHLAEIWQHHQENLSKRERKKDPPAPPVIPPCQGGVWYHEGQALLKDDSWYHRELAKRHGERDAFWSEIHDRVAAIRARDAAKAAQEAAQAAAAPPPAAPPQEAPAAPYRAPYKKSDPRFLTSTYVKPRRSKWNRQTKAEIRKAEKRYDALAPTPEQPDIWTAGYSPEAHARAILARAMGRDARRQQNAIDRSTFFCNRLIEDRFPPVQFSDMPMIKNVRHNYGYINPEDRPTREELDDETT